MLLEDLSLFIDEAEFATKAVLDNVEVQGIFDNAFLDALGGINTAQPRYTLQTTNATRVREGISLLRIVGGSTYRVISAEPDGTGLTTLLLERAK